MSEPYIIFGLELSYFTRKVEAAFRLHRLPFERRSKNLLNKRQLENRSGTHLVPVVQTPENWLIADSTPIIDLLDQRNPSRRLFPAGPQGVIVRLVEEWFDEWVPRAAIHYRWSFDESATEAALAIARENLPWAPGFAQRRLARMVRQWGGRARRALGLNDEYQREALEQEMERLWSALGKQLELTPYALGNRPTAVDAVIAGGLWAHFDRDPVPARLIEQHPSIREYLQRFENWDGSGTLAEFPNCTPFAEFVLQEMAGAFKSFSLGNRQALLQGKKSFMASIHGKEVSLLARRYPERSLNMIDQLIERRLDQNERRELATRLRGLQLSELFPALEA